MTLKIVHPYGVTLIFFLFFGRPSIQSLHYLSSMGHHVLDINFYCRNVCLRLTQHDSNARGRILTVSLVEILSDYRLACFRRLSN